jgi:membrane protease YdiL (CAAX protease family)
LKKQQTKTEFRPLWNNLFKFNWVFGLLLILAVCIPRFILVLGSNRTGNYGSISIIMIISAIAPFVFLSKYGREKIGITKPGNYQWLFYSFISGILLATILFLLGYGLYSDTVNNWFVYIGKSYNISESITEREKFIYFLIFAGTGMIFSPIGEELFFRGIVHSCFAASVGDRKASIIDGLAFSLTHLSHFGFVYLSGEWKILIMPSLLWVSGMFVSSIVFFQCKKKTGSLLGAALSHAGFNLAMIYFIFYHL